MSGLRCAKALVAIGLRLCIGFGLLAGAARAQADEVAPSNSVDPQASLRLASLPPFELPPDISLRRSAEPFGLDTTVVVMGSLLVKWSGVRQKLPREREILAQCRAGAACPAAAKRFLKVIDKAKTFEGFDRISDVNRTVNLDIKPVDDMTQYGVPDLWASPLMTYASRQGDCEDYAIAKYVALRELGFAEDDLRLVVVHIRSTDENHAIAAVHYDGRWLMLDNLTFDIRADDEITELDPLFTLDGKGVRRLVGPLARSLAPKDGINPAAAAPQAASPWPSLPPVL